MRRSRPIFPTIFVAVCLSVIVGAPAWHAGSATADRSPAAPGVRPAQEEEPVWTSTAMDGGPIYAVDMSRETTRDAKDVQHLFAAGNQVFSSTRGITWTLLGGVPRANSLVTADDGVLLVGNTEGNAYRTQTYGKRWNQSRFRERDDPMRYLAVSPVFQADGQAYGITSADYRLYRTDDHGQNWSEVIIEAGVELDAGAVAFSPLHLHDETLFLGSDRGIFRSTRSGDTWEMRAEAGPGVPAFGPDAGPIESQGMAVAFEWGTHRCRATDPDVRDLFAWNADGLWIGSDEGAEWRQITLPPAVEQLNDVVVSPGWDQDRTILIAAAGPNIVGAVSANGGETWSTIPSRDGLSGMSVTLSRDFWPIPPRLDCDPLPRESLGFDILLTTVMKNYEFPTGEGSSAKPVVINREMILATDGDGIWWSGDEGKSWQPPAVQVQAVEPTAIEHVSADVVLAGSETAGLYRSEDGGTTWSLVPGAGLPRGEGQTIHAIEASPAVASDRIVFLGAQSGLWKSVNAGATWARTNGPSPAHVIAFSPEFASDGTLISDGMISTDRGETWRPMPTADLWPWSAAAFSPRFATDRTIWASTIAIGDETEPGREEEREYGLFVSRDGGESWDEVRDSNLRNRQIFDVVAVAVNVSEPVRIITATSSGIRMSVDGGETFARNSDAGSRTIVALDSTTLREPFLTAVIVGVTERGVLWSINRGVNWQEDDDGPRDVRAISLRADGGRIAVTAPLAAWTREISLSTAAPVTVDARGISSFD